MLMASEHRRRGNGQINLPMVTAKERSQLLRLTCSPNTAIIVCVCPFLFSALSLFYSIPLLPVALLLI